MSEETTDPQSRLLGLAWRESLRRHNENADIDGYGVRERHEGKHGRCAHPDCTIVRFAAARPPSEGVAPRQILPVRLDGCKARNTFGQACYGCDGHKGPCVFGGCVDVPPAPTEAPRKPIIEELCPWCGERIGKLKPSGGCLTAEVLGWVWHPRCADEYEAARDLARAAPTEAPALDLEALLVKIRRWREDHRAGYDGVLELLCEADEVLTAALRRGGPEGVK